VRVNWLNSQAVELANALPPLEAAYHRIAVPVAVRFATVGLLPEQKVCDALPVGGPHWITNLVLNPYYTTIFRLVTHSDWLVRQVLDQVQVAGFSLLVPPAQGSSPGRLRLRLGLGVIFFRTHNLSPGLEFHTYHSKIE